MRQGEHRFFHQWSAPRSRAASFKGRVPPDREKLRLKFPGPPCRTLADMTEAEIAALEREYGCPVVRPN
jgi:hypothetical protein